jgi:2-aminoethylphosphonate dioxygenase
MTVATASLAVATLTGDQIAAFKRDGFLLAPSIFTAADVARISRWTDELVAMPEEPGRHWIYHEKSLKDSSRRLISRIENICPYHPGFAELADVLRKPVAQLMDEPAVLFKEKINFKMPGGDGFKPHQDSQAGWEKYASYFITAMVCIDEATIENGCLKIAAGQQKKGLFRAWEPMTDADMAGMEFKPYPTKPGDVVFLDTYAPHSSEPNMTDRTRRMYFSTYNKASEGDHIAAYYADKRKSYPPDIEREAGKTYVFRV